MWFIQSQTPVVSSQHRIFNPLTKPRFIWVTIIAAISWMTKRKSKDQINVKPLELKQRANILKESSIPETRNTRTVLEFFKSTGRFPRSTCFFSFECFRRDAVFQKRDMEWQMHPDRILCSMIYRFCFKLVQLWRVTLRAYHFTPFGGLGLKWQKKGFDLQKE